MKLTELRAEYHDQFDGSIKTRHFLVLCSENHQQNVETNEEDFCDLMKRLTKENKIGTRAKNHVTDKIVRLKYDVK